MGEIAHNPIRPGIDFGFMPAISRLDENGPNAGISTARDIARFVPDKIGTRQIEMVLALRLEDHAGRWLPAR